MQRGMWLSKRLLLPFMALVVAEPAVAQQKAAPADAAASAAIERANAAWAAATNRGDAAAVAALYTDDALVMQPDRPAVLGRAAIQAAAAVNVRAIRDARLTTAELEVFGSTAVERGAYDMTIVFPGREPVKARGKYLVEWKRGGDGAWRQHRQIFNSDLPAAPTADPAAVRAAIERVNAEWAAASLRHDAAAIAGQYTEDAMIMGPGALAGVGRAVIEKGVADMPPILEPRMTIAEVEVFGSTALERGAYHMTIGSPGPGAFTDDGKYLVEWKQGSDGAWRRYREIFNSDLPAPATAARALPGDTVLVVLSHVKPEMREEYVRQARETWLASWRKAGETDPAFRAAARDIRLLAPTAPDADGSYTYVVLADPHHPGMSYDARGSLAKLHPPEKVDELIRAWVATFARPQEARFVVQLSQ